MFVNSDCFCGHSWCLTSLTMFPTRLRGLKDWTGLCHRLMCEAVSRRCQVVVGWLSKQPAWWTKGLLDIILLLFSSNWFCPWLLSCTTHCFSGLLSVASNLLLSLLYLFLTVSGLLLSILDISLPLTASVSHCYQWREPNPWNHRLWYKMTALLRNTNWNLVFPHFICLFVVPVIQFLEQWESI